MVGAMVTMAASAALGAYATYESSEQQAAYAEQQAGQAREREEREARIRREQIDYEASLAAERAEWETSISLEKSEFTAGRVQEEADLVMATQIAGYAAAGLETREGSPLVVMARTASEAGRERKQISRGHEIFAEIRAKEAEEVKRGGEFTYGWFMERLHAETGYEVQSRLAEASMYRSKGQYALIGGGLKMGGSMLSGYGTYQKQGWGY